MLFLYSQTLSCIDVDTMHSHYRIQGVFSEPDAKTVIPGKISGKFSIRIVPNQTPEAMNQLAYDYINRK